MDAIPKLSLVINDPAWQVVFMIPQGTQLIKGRHGIYHEITNAAGTIKNRFICYAWGINDSINYCGSISQNYASGRYKSNLHGRIHNYLENHRRNENGRTNTNLMVFDNIRQILVDKDVYLYYLTFSWLNIGDEQVSYQNYSNDSDLIHAVEQLLIASYKRIGQCTWNRT
jgi:hypothetical protein